MENGKWKKSKIYKKEKENFQENYVKNRNKFSVKYLIFIIQLKMGTNLCHYNIYVKLYFKKIYI